MLDIGCGHGELTLAALAPLAGSVVGIDSSPEMIRAANAKVAQHADLQKKCTFLVVDAQKMHESDQLKAEAFDVVFSNAALHWCKDPAAVIAGIWRVLKPGGRFCAEAGAFMNGMGVRSELHRCLKARNLPVNDPWYFPTTEEYKKLLEAQGFEVSYIGNTLASSGAWLRLNGS